MKGGYSKREATDYPSHLPDIVVVIDELADLMMTERTRIERSIIRLAQKGHAVGIHLVVATQRPRGDVITRLIRSNFPARIAFKVSSSLESRIMLGSRGAERLLGRGDMLVSLPGRAFPERAQGTHVSNRELRRLVKFLKSKDKTVLHDGRVEQRSKSDTEQELYDEAVRIVLKGGKFSQPVLKRKLNINYTQAASLIDRMNQTLLASV